MKNQQKLDLKVRFESYKILNFNYQEPPIVKSNLKRTDFKLDFKTDIKAGLHENTIGIKLGVNVQLKKEKLLPVAFIEVEYVYKVLGLNKIPHDEKGISIPGEFLTTLISLSYSTTRGVLLAKGTGTVLEKAILPIIDPHLLLPKQMLQQEPA